MKKAIMMLAIVGFAATGFAQCGIQGISPQEREYRANPPQGFYSTQTMQCPNQYYQTNPHGYGMPARNPQGYYLKQTPFQHQSGYGYQGGQAGSYGYQGGQYQGRMMYDGDQDRSAKDKELYSNLQNALKSYNLGITVNNGIVTLQGSVNSADDKKRIEDIVYSFDGVKRLNNLVKVPSAAPAQGQNQQSMQYRRVE